MSESYSPDSTTCPNQQYPVIGSRRDTSSSSKHTTRLGHWEGRAQSPPSSRKLKPARRFEYNHTFHARCVERVPKLSIRVPFSEEAEELAEWSVFTGELPLAGRRTHTQHVMAVQKGPKPFPARSLPKTCGRSPMSSSFFPSCRPRRRRRHPNQGSSGSRTSTCSPRSGDKLPLNTELFRRHPHESPKRHSSVTPERHRHDPLTLQSAGSPDRADPPIPVSHLPAEDAAQIYGYSPELCEFTFVTWIVVPVCLSNWSIFNMLKDFATRPVFVSHVPAARCST